MGMNVLGGEKMFFGFETMCNAVNLGEPTIPLVIAIIATVILSATIFFIGYNAGKAEAKYEQSPEYKARFNHQIGDIPPGP